ncbi:hypothetical protein DLM78_17395 [Leptospira stimsonii]|uniref:Uncharacterized protein n=1 Tax=Leptospira stimsonii TaxID=2202203 RepID=A0A8B3CPN3_9LEPT|nr:hypothetical protein DLM78_17395 [Leptospira stimsonii]
MFLRSWSWNTGSNLPLFESEDFAENFSRNGLKERKQSFFAENYFVRTPTDFVVKDGPTQILGGGVGGGKTTR